MDNSEQIRFPMKLVTKSKNSGRSVDHHFQNGAVTVSLSLSPVIAANTLVMHTSKQIASQVTYLQDKQSLTLRWHSFSAWGCNGASAKSEIIYRNRTPHTNISQVSQNYEIGCDCIFFNQVSGSFISWLGWPIAMLDMWNPTANCTLLILHFEISLTNLEPLQPYFICLNCIYSVITINIPILITITMATISTPEAIIYLLLASFASSPSPRQSRYTDLLHEALSKLSSLLLTVFRFKIVQINGDRFTGRHNPVASSSTSIQCKGTGVRTLLALDLMFKFTSTADPFRTFTDQLRLIHRYA